MICIFLNVSLIHDQTSKTSKSNIVNMAEENLNKTEKYIKDVIKVRSTGKTNTHSYENVSRFDQFCLLFV